MILIEHILIPAKKGSDVYISSRITRDYLPLKWWETDKRILRKTTENGQDIAIRLQKETDRIGHNDLLYLNETENTAIIARIEAEQTICIRPKDMAEMARACYEIGNKHAPLFYNHDELLLPFDQPMYDWLSAAGFAPTADERILQNPLRANSAPGIGAGGHSHTHNHSHDHQH